MEVLGRDWLDLPPEILDLIVRKVNGNRDFIVFGSVCKTWQLASSLVKHPESPPEFPLLMLSDGTKMYDETYEEELKHIVEKRTFFNISSSSSRFEITLPEAYGKKCFAVNFGWLLTLSMKEEIELLHPFSRRRIKLPNVQAFSTPHEFTDMSFEWGVSFITKAVISCPPNNDQQQNDDCIIFIIFDLKNLAFTRICDQYWTTIHAADETQNFVDIIYTKGLLYALDWDGVVYTFDINNLLFVAITPPPPGSIAGENLLYLVESDDNLLFVKRIHLMTDDDDEVHREYLSDGEYNISRPAHSNDETKSYYTSDFIIFKMETDEGQKSRYPYKWTKVKNLGNRALFLGDNMSLCLTTTLQNNNIIEGNCIYFTDNNITHYCGNLNGGGYDTGIFKVEDKSIQLYCTDSRSFYCTP